MCILLKLHGDGSADTGWQCRWHGADDVESDGTNEQSC